MPTSENVHNFLSTVDSCQEGAGDRVIEVEEGGVPHTHPETLTAPLPTCPNHELDGLVLRQGEQSLEREEVERGREGSLNL